VASLLEIHETHLVHEELRSRGQLNICFSQRKCTPGQVGGQNHISDPETALWEVTTRVSEPCGFRTVSAGRKRTVESVDYSMGVRFSSLPTYTAK
jgi:hypothetical protein